MDEKWAKAGKWAKAMRATATAAGVGARVVRLVGRLGWAGGGGLVRLALARRRAVAGFGQGLADAGLPAEVVGELKAAYPSLSVRELMRKRRGGGAKGGAA